MDVITKIAPQLRGSIDNYQLYSLGHYPGAVPGNGTVHGEVYRIDNATLAELDALRTRGGEYARQLIQTPYGSAWMYVYQRPVDGLKLIESDREDAEKSGRRRFRLLRILRC